MPTKEKLRWPVYLLSLILHASLLFFVKIDANQKTLNTETLHDAKVTLKVREIDPVIKERLKKRQVVNNEFTGEDRALKTGGYYGKKNQTYKEEMIPAKVGQFSEAGGDKKEKSLRDQKNSKQLKMSDLLIKKPGNIEEYAVKQTNKHKTFHLEITNSELASNSDYIEGVKLGDATNLNTQEFKYWGFYNRMRLRLEPIWEKLLDERLRKYFTHGKRIVIGNDTMTLIKITLDEEGNVFRIKVLSSSGIAEVDDIAIDAITLSSKFPSVPRDMLKDKLAEIEWGFVVRP